MDHTYFGQKISFWAKAQPNSIVLQCSENSISYVELAQIVDKTQTLWEEHQIKKSNPVAILLARGLPKVLCISSLLASGIPGLVISQKMSKTERLELLRKFPFSAVITTRFIANELKSFLQISGPESELELKHFSDDLVCLKLNPALSEDSVCDWALLTSGSTGQAKIAKLSSDNLIDRTQGEIDLFKIGSQSRILNVLSFGHDLGLNQLLSTLVAGASLELLNLALAPDILAVLEAKLVDSFTCTPFLWHRILDCAAQKKCRPFDHYLGLLTVSGGQLPSEKLVQLCQLFPNANIVKTYGQTETFRTFVDTRKSKVLSSLVGSALPGVMALVVDENYKICKVGEVGQLVHFGPGIMSGYWMDTEQTSIKMISSRLFPSCGLPKSLGILTGDYFKVIATDEFQFVGRHDDIIKRLDTRISLAEIERLLLDSKLVDEVCAAKSPGHNRWGLDDGKIIAFLRPKNLDQNIAKEIEEYCFKNITPYKIPDQFCMVESIPFTASQKPDRVKLLRGIENE